MKLSIRMLILTLISISLLLSVSCQNTAKGFGQDMQKNGQDIRNAVNNN